MEINDYISENFINSGSPDLSHKVIYLISNDYNEDLIDTLSKEEEKKIITLKIAEQKMTLIQYCLLNGTLPCFEYLINFLKNKIRKNLLKHFLNRCDNQGNTALLFASYRGNIKIIETLIELGADWNMANLKGLNVLHMAAQGDNPNVLIYFKEKYKMSIYTGDFQGNLPLHWACYYSAENSVNYLLSYMPNINIQNKNGLTPMHISVYTEKISLIKKLINKGSDLSIKEKNGKTALNLAIEITGKTSKVSLNIYEASKDKSCLKFISNFDSTQEDKIDFNDYTLMVDNNENPKNTNFINDKKSLTNPISFSISITIYLLIYAFLQLDHINNISINYNVFFISIMIIYTITYIYLVFSDPGIIKDELKYSWLELVLKNYNIKSMCPYCKVMKSKFSHHCFICGKCVVERTHHCYFINNCIGNNNRFSFMLFLLMNLVLFVYLFYSSFYIFLLYTPTVNINDYWLPFDLLYADNLKYSASIFFIITSFIFFIITSILLYKTIRKTLLFYKINEIN